MLIGYAVILAFWLYMTFLLLYLDIEGMRFSKEKFRERIRGAARWVVFVLICPVRGLSALLHRVYPHDKRKSHVLFGMLLMAAGSTIAMIGPEEHGPLHVVVDSVAYAIHGFGCAPIVKAIADWIGMEL